jgi:hypothetical protein
MRRPLRFVQVGLGPLGLRIANDVPRRRLGRVVAAIDPALAGRDVTDFIPSAPAGTRVLASVEELGVRADVAVVATVSDLVGCAPTLRALLGRHISVVSTCEELAWPWDGQSDLAGELLQLALSKGVHLLGSGVNPGFVMDALPVALSTACSLVSRIEIRRIQDASIRRLPFQQKIGATLEVAEFERRAAAGTVRHVGLRESACMIADALGLRLDRIEQTLAPVIAEAPVTCALGVCAAGAVRGVHQEARGFAGAREVIALVFRAAIGEPAPRDQILIEGEPPIDLTIAGGLHGDVATAAVTLNAIVGLLDLDCAPGLHAMTTIPLRGCAPPR